MIFKLDENLPVELADLLKSENWEACTVYEEHLSGKPDSTIADICKKEKKVLVSLDLDFSDIRTYPPKEYNGIIVLRLIKSDKLYVLEVFKNLLKLLIKEEIVGKLWVVEETRIRIREE